MQQRNKKEKIKYKVEPGGWVAFIKRKLKDAKSLISSLYCIFDEVLYHTRVGLLTKRTNSLEEASSL